MKVCMQAQQWHPSSTFSHLCGGCESLSKRHMNVYLFPDLHLPSVMPTSSFPGLTNGRISTLSPEHECGCPVRQRCGNTWLLMRKCDQHLDVSSCIDLWIVYWVPVWKEVLVSLDLVLSLQVSGFFGLLRVDKRSFPFGCAAGPAGVFRGHVRVDSNVSTWPPG